jgi:AraC-like DNA-binding protein
MLKPFDSIWKQSSKISKAKYFNLKHGEYQLYYKAANNDGVWTNVSKPLTIIVLPKFYQTKWFYLLVTLFVLLIFFGFLIYRWYLKRKHKRQKKLLRYKTSSLADDKAKLINSKLISLLQKKPIYLESDLSLYSLADQLQVKPHYLSQVINQYHQRNFQDFINLYRVKKAKELLIKTQLKIEAIAYDSGFNSISTFYTAFKKEMGTTPASYRKKNCE